MRDDYGYFGKGLTGYAHYMQSFNTTFGGTQSTHVHKSRRPNKDSGHVKYPKAIIVLAVLGYIMLFIKILMTC